MHQTRMLAALLQHLGDDRLLADMVLGDVLDPDSRTRRQLRRPSAHAVTKLQGELGIIEDAYLVGIQKPRHALGVTNRRKPPVVTVRS